VLLLVITVTYVAGSDARFPYVVMPGQAGIQPGGAVVGNQTFWILLSREWRDRKYLSVIGTGVLSREPRPEALLGC
jgi:hypothetical protein